MMKGIWVGALQILLPEVRSGAGAQRASRFPADLLPRRCRPCSSLLESSEGEGLRPRQGPHVQQRRRAVSGRSARAVGENGRTPAQRRLRPFGNVAGHAQHCAALARASSGSIGLPVPDTDMKIVDVETGLREMPVGETGELCIAGPQVFDGLLEPARGNGVRAAHAPRRPHLVPHRRHRAHGRGRLQLHRPAQEGHDHRRRLQRVSVGGGRRCSMRIRPCGSRP